MKVFTIIFLLLFSISLYSQTKLPKQFRSSYEGNEFVVAFMQNEILAGVNVDQKILISSRYNTSATVSYPDSTFEVYTISPLNSKSIPVPMSFMNASPGQEFRKNIIINSSRNISVYAYSSQYMSSDMFAVIPTSRWGYEYQAITKGIDHYATTDNPTTDPKLGAPRSGEFLIIANEDNTLVKFTPRKETKNHPGNQETTIMLDKWESYLVQSKESQTKTANDLSGSVITANKKIGLISGHMRSAVPPKLEERSSDSKDHLVEMLNSTEYFGKEYVTAPFSHGIKSLFAVTTLEERAEIEILTNEGTQTVNLGFPGAVKYVRVDGAAKWTSDNKFQLAQFMARYGEEDEDCNEFYDPAFAIIHPMDFFNNNLNFLTVSYNESGYNHRDREPVCGGNHKNRQYISHHAILIAKDGARYHTKVDGLNYQVSNFEGTIPGTDYYFGYIDLEPGDHIIETEEGGFQGILYGRGFYDSYAYSLGSSILSNDVEDSVELDITYSNDCETFVATITDNDEFLSGIQFVDINNSSYNLEILEHEFQYSTANIRVKHKNKRQDAFVSIDYFDNAGNGMNVNHFFKGINPKVNDVNLGQILYDEDKVYYFNLTNEGNHDIQIKNIKFDSNRFFLAEIFSEFTLLAKETKQIGFMIRNQDVSNIPLENFIYVESECSVIDTAQLNLDIVQYNFNGKGYDFGDVLLGDNECGNIYFENTDELPLTILNLDFSQTHITLDTAGLFPIKLLQNERIDIRACTNPMTRDNVNLEVSANSLGILGNGELLDTVNLIKTVYVTERIIGAEFEDVYYDFGTVYKDRNYSQNIKIENTGNHEGNPIFFGLNVQNDKMSLQNDNVVDNISSTNFPINHSQEFDFYFDPLNSGFYSNTFTFDYQEGVLDRTFNIIIEGNALASNLTTRDCSEDLFDTVYTIETKTIPNVTLLEYEGDVDRTIYLPPKPYKLFYSQIGSTTVEEINLSDNPFDLNNISFNSIIKNGERITSDIEFKPEYEGYFELKCLIITNSIDEGRTIDSLFASICAVALDPIFPELEFVFSNNDVWACDTTILNARITNIGETDVLINEINLESTYYSNLLFDKANLPLQLNMNQDLNLPIEVFRRKNETDSIILTAEATDLEGEFSSTFPISKEINPNTSQLILPNLSFSYNISDTSTVNIYGDIPYDIDIPEKMTIEIEHDYSVLWLNSNESILRITSSNGSEQKIPVNIVNEPGKIRFDIPYFEFEVDGDVRWSLDLDFLIMMSNKFNSELIVSVFSEECFENNSITYPIDIDEVCIQTSRLIEHFDSGDINTHFDYTKNELMVDLEIPVNSDISIYLVDMLGKIIDLEEKKFVNKGNYFLNYDLNFIPNGNYFLFVETKYITDKRKIIIIK